MKVTTKTTQQDGTVVTDTRVIPFSRGISQPTITLVPDEDEPICVHIIRAGWHDGGPTFHVLVEYGDFMQTDYMYCRMDEVVDKFPDFERIYKEFNPDTVITHSELTNMPNDNELGRYVRSNSFDIHSSRTLQ